ncbi:hypothetical protein IE53DRAFT_42776 [Violaceomyces palustris]|uniref:Uncharacterized protein n=1 Tax=Violaceomyces palustris TaxID=1673888 RepID=A0ACD0P0U5_9BASI|nr:hypothetical protein IE53DRAFT_42776 [Violaceomyces palustris]
MFAEASFPPSPLPFTSFQGVVPSPLYFGPSTSVFFLFWNAVGEKKSKNKTTKKEDYILISPPPPWKRFFFLSLLPARLTSHAYPTPAWLLSLPFDTPFPNAPTPPLPHTLRCFVRNSAETGGGGVPRLMYPFHSISYLILFFKTQPFSSSAPPGYASHLGLALRSILLFVLSFIF